MLANGDPFEPHEPQSTVLTRALQRCRRGADQLLSYLIKKFEPKLKVPKVEVVDWQLDFGPVFGVRRSTQGERGDPHQ